MIFSLLCFGVSPSTDGVYSEGCSQTETYLIDEPSLLVIDEVDVIDVDCFGDDTGSITPSVEGGTAPYTYLWSNGDNNDVLENVESGTYDLTVEDFNGCIDVFTGINISQPASQVSVSDFVEFFVFVGARRVGVLFSKS